MPRSGPAIVRRRWWVQSMDPNRCEEPHDHQGNEALRNTRKQRGTFWSPRTVSLRAGDHLQGSEKLYGAVTQAIIAICQQRGWRYKSHRAMQQAVEALSREYRDPTLLNGYLAASKFHENFFHDNMEDYEVEANRPGVHHFVGQLLTLLDSE